MSKQQWWLENDYQGRDFSDYERQESRSDC